MKISEKQLAQVNDRIKALVTAGSFYGKKLEEAGITSVANAEEFEKLPFSEKADLRDAYPLGLMTAPEEEIVRIHSSSGTTGLPVIIPYTAKDVDDWGEMFRRCYETAGITNKDRIHITPGYGLWTAGIGFQNGCEKLGAMAIPMGPGNTEKQLQMMMDLKSTVLCSTSSYALLLAEEIEKRGIRDKIHLKKGVIGSERWGKAMRERIQGILGIELYDIYGLTEIYGPGIGINCPNSEYMHIWDDYVYLEIIDPQTGENLPDGEWGEIVITTLVKEGAPLIRYRTHDLRHDEDQGRQCIPGSDRGSHREVRGRFQRVSDPHFPLRRPRHDASLRRGGRRQRGLREPRQADRPEDQGRHRLHADRQDRRERPPSEKREEVEARDRRALPVNGRLSPECPKGIRGYCFALFYLVVFQCIHSLYICSIFRLEPFVLPVN